MVDDNGVATSGQRIQYPSPRQLRRRAQAGRRQGLGRRATHSQHASTLAVERQRDSTSKPIALKKTRADERRSLVVLVIACPSARSPLRREPAARRSIKAASPTSAASYESPSRPSIRCSTRASSSALRGRGVEAHRLLALSYFLSQKRTPPRRGRSSSLLALRPDLRARSDRRPAGGGALLRRRQAPSSEDQRCDADPAAPAHEEERLRTARPRSGAGCARRERVVGDRQAGDHDTAASRAAVPFGVGQFQNGEREQVAASSSPPAECGVRRRCRWRRADRHRRALPRRRVPPRRSGAPPGHALALVVGRRRSGRWSRGASSTRRCTSSPDVVERAVPVGRRRAPEDVAWPPSLTPGFYGLGRCRERF